MRKRNSQTWWRRTATTFLGVLFGTYRRCRRDVLIGRRGYVLPRRLGNVHWDVVGCFIWNLFETSWRRTERTSLLSPLRRHYNCPIRRHGDIPLRRIGDVPSRRCWVFHLGRTCDVTGTYRETSLRRYQTF